MSDPGTLKEGILVAQQPMVRSTASRVLVSRFYLKRRKQHEPAEIAISIPTTAHIYWSAMWYEVVVSRFALKPWENDKPAARSCPFKTTVA